MDVCTRLPIFGQHLLADGFGGSGVALSQQHNHLAKLLIAPLRNDKRFAQMSTKQPFYLLSLNLQPTRTDNVVFATENLEPPVIGEFCVLVGYEVSVLDQRGVDDETALSAICDKVSVMP